MTGAVRVLAVCADDFGLSPGISQGIARLARAQRLNGISCLANAMHWRSGAPLLKDLPPGVDVGLHFNLTEGEPLSPDLRRVWPRLPSLARLLAAAHLHALPQAEIAAEWSAQRSAFVDALNCEPAFVDGHQHVHHLPLVRNILLDGISGMHPTPAMRNTGRVLGPGFGFKRAVIAGTGGRRLQRALNERGVAHNAALLGVYDFSPGTYRQWMRGWLAAVPREGALLFCHPGAVDASGIGDAIAAARAPEATYLGSSEFADDLAAANVVLGRVWRVGAAHG